MSFENAEKKIEITFKQGSKSLKILPKAFWDTLAAKAKVRILSSVNSPLCDSYLLSESSLFVFPQKLLLITSGQGSLLGMVEHVLSHFKLEEVDAFFYEVKGESYQNDFLKEAFALSQLIPGTLMNLGDRDSDQVSLFYLDRPSAHIKNSEATFEILIHELDPIFQEVFALDKASARKWLSEGSGFKSFFESFDVQDFSFQPFGYSLNAIKGDKYFTFHVSPHERGSFASLETNFVEIGAEKLLEASYSLFKPRSLQLVSYSPHKNIEFSAPQLFILKAQAEKRLSNGFFLQYFDYRTPAAAGFIEEIQMSKSLLSHSQIDFFKDDSPKGSAEESYASSVEDLASYGEMFSHVPLFVHPNPFRVLIMGDSSFSISREVLKHDSVQDCVLVSNDAAALESSKSQFSWALETSKDPRLSVKVQDLISFIKEPEHQFDVILVVDTKVFSRDGSSLEKIKELLAPGGILVCEASSPVAFASEQRSLKSVLMSHFSKIFFYNYLKLSSKNALQSFVYASDNYHPVEEFDREKALKSKIDFYYYNTEIHYASFFLPTFMRKNLLQAKASSVLNSTNSSADLSV